MSHRQRSSFAKPQDDKNLEHLVDGLLNCNGRAKPPSRQVSRRTQRSASFQPKEHENLPTAVDDLLKEHQDTIPRRPYGVAHKDSFSSWGTAPGGPDPKLLGMTYATSENKFPPIEISFPTADADNQPPPQLQKSKRDIPDVYDFEEDEQEDIVFALADDEVASCTSSMEVVRKVSSRLTSSYRTNNSSKLGRHSTSTKSRATRPTLNRGPSRGMSMAAGPPVRTATHQPSFHMTRAEF